MQPIFENNPLLAGVLVTSMIIWRVLEAGVDIKSYLRLRAGARRTDQGSQIFLIVILVLGVLGCIAVADKVPATSIMFARPFFFWLGILLIYAGIALRLYAINVLGDFFTTTVAIAPQQTMIESGPYRRIRHPSY